MATFSAKDDYTVEDLLHFGYGHIDTARVLFKDDPTFLDSAGYLAHLGTEIVLKAWHLHWFAQFDDTHDLVKLYNQLKGKDGSLNLGAEHESFLAELNKFYLLRYPRRKKGPVEVGSEQLKQFDSFLDALWQKFPKELIEIYQKLDYTKKGGRILMRKKIDVAEKLTDRGKV